jgi:hypothetical protein
MITGKWAAGNWTHYLFDDTEGAQAFVKEMAEKGIEDVSSYEGGNGAISYATAGPDGTYMIARQQATQLEPDELCLLGAIETATGQLGYERIVAEQATTLLSDVLVEKYGAIQRANPDATVYEYNDASARTEDEAAIVLLDSADVYDGLL